jgi:hypothetical protein
MSQVKLTALLYKNFQLTRDFSGRAGLLKLSDLRHSTSGVSETDFLVALIPTLVQHLEVAQLRTGNLYSRDVFINFVNPDHLMSAILLA